MAINERIEIIDINDARVGMTIGQDIITSTNMFLLEKGTSLTEKTIKRLRLYDINKVPIKRVRKKEDIEIEHDNEVVEVIKDNNQGEKIKELHEFKVFSSNYNSNREMFKNNILEISEGKSIEIDNLFSISNDLISSTDSKSSLINFISHLENFDDHTFSHSINVSLIAFTLGQWLGFEENQLKELAVAGLIHDIGKTEIDINIINKPGALDKKELEIIRGHALSGFRTIEKQDIPYNVKMAVLMHHERYDGSGYPLGAKNDQISDYAKIVAIADIYDAMTSNRAYRDKYCPFEVIRCLYDEHLTKLDTQFLMTFLYNIAYCYLDNWVELSTGEEGKIVFINKYKPASPIVQVDNVMVDLSEETNISITKIL